MNQYNEKSRALAKAQQAVADKNSEMEYLRTSPFIAIFALVVSTIGSVLLSMGVNLFTADPPMTGGFALVCLAGALILSAGSLNLLYPFARRWFNRKPRRS